MLPLMEKELVENKKWVEKEELLDFYAVSQSTPGVIAVNTATFIGHKKNGLVGSIFAVIGMITPSIIVICSLFFILSFLKENIIFQKIFKGIRVSVAVLILYSVYKISTGIPKSKMGVIISISAFILSFLYIDTIFIIVLSGLIGFWAYKGEKND